MLGEKLGRLRKDVGVHHGSLPREERERVEQAFKSGALKALVCTSTLELGIDVGSVDLVVQYMSPRQVTSLVQRVGRSGHTLGKTSKGILVTVSADDILESSASIISASQGKIEPTRPFCNSLDVLAHQIAGYLMDFETMDAGQGSRRNQEGRAVQGLQRRRVHAHRQLPFGASEDQVRWQDTLEDEADEGVLLRESVDDSRRDQVPRGRRVDEPDSRDSGRGVRSSECEGRGPLRLQGEDLAGRTDRRRQEDLRHSGGGPAGRRAWLGRGDAPDTLRPCRGDREAEKGDL